ncbi:ATP-dependent DNA helicase RecG [Rosistilla carotiformis]|uniref:ATP-dependent DNA helicase RecG n=1 Tax=Rosistilla carotiformis TaxID=2528017 RepID=A0A518JTE0_9BACT|nr:ATP-dependent DNA helicase RecG [Rosistilla carotiformis]QDV68809.1 ATP-dependent DNA helicase RecG [Rosistilla carotiformis]
MNLNSESATKLNLATATQFIKGVGPSRAEQLLRLGLRAARDLLFFLPRDYEHPAPATRIADLREDQPASFVATITEVDVITTQAGKTILGVLVEDGSGAARLMFFNQPYRIDSMPRGQRVLISGKPRLSGLRMEMVHPKVIPLEEDETPTAQGILPIYPLTEGINQGQMRRAIATVVDELAGEIAEVIPASIRETASLLSIEAAIRNIHQPQDQASLDAARRRLIFQELFILQLALAIRRRKLTSDLRAPPLPVDAAIDARILKRFPFELTGDQKKAFAEVSSDMARQFPMNRLVQGDVGSGKTVIAQYAMLLAVANKHQAVLMAPTEVLARQHFETFRKSLSRSRVRLGLLTGTLSTLDRRDVLKAAAEGEIDLLVGTQALLNQEVAFKQLGLVVIDEQHKFGVSQRANLRRGGLDPHYLVLSATPIPRTVAMAAFGDLDVSTLKEKPPGRSQVNTYLAKDDWAQRWWEFLAQRVREGRQAFVVTPRVDSGEQEDVSGAQQVFDELRTGPLKKFRIGLLHGRMPPEEKNETMLRFAQGRLQVLVATTVIEVGIDVPNATVMTILGANRFGLAQLHQLRGRVWRGSHPGYVCVFTDKEGLPEDDERLKTFAETSDGFALAEADYRMRGPGDLLGVRQSGMPPLRVADPLRDTAILEAARDLAMEIVDNDPHLEDPDLALLKQRVLTRYGSSLDLGDVA